MLYYPPESWFAKPGYDELLLYSEAIDDDPVFSSIDIKNIFRAKHYSLAPRFDAQTDADLINGWPDKSLFSVNPVKIEGNFTYDLMSNIYGGIDFPVAKMWEHMRCAWVGIEDDGSLISPLSDWVSEHSWFSLGSAYHGTFTQCLVNSLSISIKPDGPVEFEIGVVATGYLPKNVFTYQALTQDDAIQYPKYEQRRRQVLARDFTISSGAGSVIGHWGLPDSSNSIFATGINKPTMLDDTITNLTINFNNKLEPQYSMRSHEILDHRARFEQNSFPSCYGASGQREISGSIEWFGNSNPLTFIEKLMGPGAIQDGGELTISSKFFKLVLKELIWKLSVKEFSLTGKMSRRADFSVATDGWLAIPYYNVDFS